MIASVLPLVGRRLLAAVLILLFVSLLLFVVLRVLPVDPAAMSMPPTATHRRDRGEAAGDGARSAAAVAICDLAVAGAAWRFRHVDPFPTAASRPCRRRPCRRPSSSRCSSMVIAAVLGIGWRACLVLRARQRERARDRSRHDLAAVDPGIPLGAVFHSALRCRACPGCRLPAGSIQNLSASGRHRVSAGRRVDRRPFRYLLECNAAHDPAGVSGARHRVFADRSCGCCARACSTSITTTTFT